MKEAPRHWKLAGTINPGFSLFLLRANFSAAVADRESIKHKLEENVFSSSC